MSTDKINAVNLNLYERVNPLKGATAGESRGIEGRSRQPQQTMSPYGTLQSELNEISGYGFEKAQRSGLGATNQPDNHRLFYYA